MTDEQAQAEAGTAEAQGPITITRELEDFLFQRRKELFEKFDLRYTIPADVIDEAERRVEQVGTEIESEVDGRTDLREMTAWTTDPADAQDFDDAISVFEHDDEYELYVHIADVTHYVTPETTMWAHSR